MGEIGAGWQGIEEAIMGKKERSEREQELVPC